MRPVVPLLLFAATLAPAQHLSPEQLFNSAVQAQQQGDYPTAIRDYRRLLQLQPNLVEARVNLGAALAHSGQFDDAIAQYRQALPHAPDKEAVRMNIGLAYYKKNDLADARREFEEVLKARPDDAQVAILLGDIEVKQGQGSHALAMLTPLEPENAANPDFEYVLGEAQIEAGDRRAGAERLAKLAVQTQSADAYLLAGSTLLDLNDAEHARSNLEAALRLNPNLPRINTLTGMARDRTGDQAAAEPVFEQALKQNPNDFEANLYLGAILYKHRKVEEAKPYLDRALALNPSSTMALYENALWNSSAGRYEDAAKQLEAAVKMDPDWLEPHVELATVYYRLHRPTDGAKERAIVSRLTEQQQRKGPAVP